MGPGLYVPSDVDRARPEQRAVELAARYPRAALSGWGALWFHGAAFFDGRGPDGTSPRPLTVALGWGRGCRRGPEVRLRYEPLLPGDVIRRGSVHLLTPVRALFDEVRIADGWREAAVAVDMALAAGLVTPEHLADYADLRQGWRHGRRVLTALDHSSTRSASPNESRLRLVWTADAGLPPPLVNEDVHDLDGRFVCRPDLLDPEAGMVCEFDGADHRTAARHSSDVAREERCREVGLEYVKVTGLDLLDPVRVVARLLAARARASFAPPSQRAWRLARDLPLPAV